MIKFSWEDFFWKWPIFHNFKRKSNPTMRHSIGYVQKMLICHTKLSLIQNITTGTTRHYAVSLNLLPFRHSWTHLFRNSGTFSRNIPNWTALNGKVAKMHGHQTWTRALTERVLKLDVRVSLTLTRWQHKLTNGLNVIFRMTKIGGSSLLRNDRSFCSEDRPLGVHRNNHAAWFMHEVILYKLYNITYII